MPLILNGKKVQQERAVELHNQISSSGIVPTLAIIQIGDRADTASYVRAKQSFAEKIGARVQHVQFSEASTQTEVVQKISQLNNDSSVHGIIVQLPVPLHLDVATIINTINSDKDVDGLTVIQVEKRNTGDGTAIVPATTRGIGELLEYYHIEVHNKKVIVMGRSKLVGEPTAWLMKKNGAHVEVVHSTTEHPTKVTQSADILIVAIGKKMLVSTSYVRKGQIIVDVGINEEEGEGLVGDVDFENVESIIGDEGAITPVPGGVGPMTVLGLFENLVDVALRG